MADAPHDPQALRDQWKAGWDSAMGFRYVRVSRDEVVVEYDEDGLRSLKELDDFA